MSCVCFIKKKKKGKKEMKALIWETSGWAGERNTRTACECECECHNGKIKIGQKKRERENDRNDAIDVYEIERKVCIFYPIRPSNVCCYLTMHSATPTLATSLSVTHYLSRGARASACASVFVNCFISFENK